jgi:peptidoglycan-associated lipoprotein
LKKGLFALGLGVSIFFIGCTNQPQIDVVDENETEQNKTVITQPEQKDTTVVDVKPTEENLSTENTSVLTETVVEENNSLTNEDMQKISALLANKAIYFDFDKFEIRNDMIDVLSEVANMLKDNKKTFTIRLEGNCDEWGSDEYNYALGLKRAKAVKSYLSSLGLDSDKLTIISYGESNPVCSDHKSSCWSKNRRVNFTILP